MYDSDRHSLPCGVIGCVGEGKALAPRLQRVLALHQSALSDNNPLVTHFSLRVLIPLKSLRYCGTTPNKVKVFKRESDRLFWLMTGRQLISD